MQTFLTRWLPVIGWAVVIFSFSTEEFASVETFRMMHRLAAWIWPGISPAALDAVNYAARKFGHWSEYFALAVLLSRALQPESERLGNGRRGRWTLLIVFLYACGDELHQAFVPSRSARFTDVLLDFSGAVCGLSWLYIWRKSRAEGMRGRSGDAGKGRYRYEERETK